MSPKQGDREYDIVLVGATGYTGALTAHAIAELLPTNLKWAIAGRSQAKLETLASKLKNSFSDRLEPKIEPVALNQLDQVAALVKRAKVCISTVLFHEVGAIVVQACAENGIDYIDCAGDFPRIRQWIKAHHETAKANGAAIIVASGVFSAPHDIITRLAVNELATKASVKTKEVIITYTDLAISNSGGTMDSIGSQHLLDPKDIAEAVEPWALSPIKGASDVSDPVSSLGTRQESTLGLLVASSPCALQNRIFVHRSWGLLGGADGYGPNFRFSEYMTATSTFDAFIKFLSITFIGVLFSNPFIYRYVVRPMSPAPGDGPDVESQHRQTVGLQALAVAEDGKTKALSSFKYRGGTYRTTAVFLAQGAASLLYKRTLLGGHEGGILTPVILGDDFVDRMASAGAEFETRLV